MIVENECYENEMAGIGQRTDAQTTLIGNYSHHNKRAGIGFEECKAGRAAVVDNRVIDNALVAVGIHTGWTVTLTGNELSRQGGLPPIVMVFPGATATFSDNTIRGQGVAGIRVAGTVRADGNRFVGTSLRKGGPPNFGIWALDGSDVSLSRNKFSTWRHALFASKSRVAAIENTIEDFHKTAIVVKNPSGPAAVYGNTAHSSTAGAKVVDVDGETNVVSDNVVKAVVKP
jgi:hypothetical protein